MAEHPFTAAIRVSAVLATTCFLVLVLPNLIRLWGIEENIQKACDVLKVGEPEVDTPWFPVVLPEEVRVRGRYAVEEDAPPGRTEGRYTRRVVVRGSYHLEKGSLQLQGIGRYKRIEMKITIIGGSRR